MAIFLLRSEHGASYVPPPATGNVFNDVPANHAYAAWIEEFAREGITDNLNLHPHKLFPEWNYTIRPNPN